MHIVPVVNSSLLSLQFRLLFAVGDILYLCCEYELHIESFQVRQTLPSQQKYRHDENVIATTPMQYRQIESGYQSTHEFVTGTLNITLVDACSHFNIYLFPGQMRVS